MNIKENKRLLIGIGVILLVVVLLLVLFLVFKPGMKKNEDVMDETSKTIIDMNNKSNVELRDDNRKVNTSKKVNSNRNLDGIEISDIELYATADISYFKAKVTNTNNTNFSGEVATITFKDKDGEILNTLEVVIPEMASKGTNEIQSSTSSDIANAYDFDIKLNNG